MLKGLRRLFETVAVLALIGFGTKARAAEDIQLVQMPSVPEDLSKEVVYDGSAAESEKALNQNQPEANNLLKHPVVAIVVDDMGVNQARTKEMLQLKGALTSSFLTYGAHLKELVESARQAGHEVILHAPMEPKGPASLAPDTLKTEMDDAEIERLFLQMLQKFDGLNIKGVNNHMGSKLTEDKEKLGVVMSLVKERGLYYLDSKTTSSPVARELAQEDGVAYAARDVFLDNVAEENAISERLTQAENIARKKGYAVAICHPKTPTYKVLKAWLEGLAFNDVRLVHLEDVVAIANVQTENTNF